ncbi:hypothetical protein LTR94_035314, partial [Friedmanniomyces endolithicus]
HERHERLQRQHARRRRADQRDRPYARHRFPQRPARALLARRHPAPERRVDRQRRV